MARGDLFAKIPLIGMCLVFVAMFIVAVTAYLHAGWYSIIGYAIAAVVARQTLQLVPHVVFQIVDQQLGHMYLKASR